MRSSATRSARSRSVAETSGGHGSTGPVGRSIGGGEVAVSAREHGSLAPAAPRSGASPGQIPPGLPPLEQAGLSVLHQCGNALLDGGLGALQAVLGLGTVLLDRRLYAAAPPLELALHPVAGLTHARPGLATSAGAAPLEPVQLALHSRADALQLAVGGLARGEPLDDLGDPGGDSQGRARGNGEGPLGGLSFVGGAAVAGLRQTLADRRGVAAAGARRVGALAWRGVPALGGPGGLPLGVAIWCHTSSRTPLGGSLALSPDVLIYKVIRVYQPEQVFVPHPSSRVTAPRMTAPRGGRISPLCTANSARRG